MIPLADVPALLTHLRTHEPTRPRVTWYGPDGERIELSGKVTDNWVAKTANLLVDDLDVGPGSRVRLDLPVHWRSLVWTLATWAAGAEVVLDPDGDPADVLVTTDLLAAQSASAQPVLVALPGLATSFGGPVPPGAVDAAAEVRLHGDRFEPAHHPAADDPALDGIPYGDLVDRALLHQAHGTPAGARVLLDAAAAPDPLRSWLPVLLLDGSLVLHHDLTGLTPARRQALEQAERVG